MKPIYFFGRENSEKTKFMSSLHPFLSFSFLLPFLTFHLTLARDDMKNKAPLHSPRPPPQDLVDAYLHSQNECKQNTGIESNADIDTGARRSSTDGNHGSYRRNMRRASWCLSKREENKPSISVLLKKLREKSEQFFDLSEMFLLIDNKGRDILDLPPGFDSSPAAALQRCQEEKNTMTELAASNQIYLEIEKTDMNTVRASHAFAYTPNPPPLPFQLRHSKLVSAKSQEDISSSEFHIQDTYNSADNDDNDNMDTLQSKLQQQFQSQPQSQSHLQMQMQLHRHRLEHQSNQNYCPSARDVPLVKQGDLAFYSPSNIISRLLCMYDPLILYITKVNIRILHVLEL